MESRNTRLTRIVARIGSTLDLDSCWVWRGHIDDTGYGRFGKLSAHRLVYELLVEPIPPGMTIDHLCRNKPCVNPNHLEVTTHRTNILRSDGVSARHARKTHCKNGHPFNLVNTYIRKDNGCRMCRTCRKEAMRRYSAAKRS